MAASKFVSVEPQGSKPLPKPTLPGSYGESHLLLLVRDPQTLFAAWDVSPQTVEGLKARIGARSLAVSNMTLRLFREGGVVTVFHLTKKARSRYVKIDGNSPSFVAEIGFTTPAGRFELIARSAPCFVPLGLAPKAQAGVRRAVIGYREARALVRRGLASSTPGSRARTRKSLVAASGGASSSMQTSSTRVLGGASDLYRR